MSLIFKIRNKKKKRWATYNELLKNATVFILAKSPSTIVIENKDYDIVESTGLKDKNGEEIFRGDIVKFENKYYGVYRDEGYLEYYIMNGEDNNPMYSYADYEIVGNIYETPKLIE